MEATEVSIYNFNSMLMCSGSQCICEQMRRGAKLLIIAFCGAKAAASLQRCVWMRSRSQEWWDCDVNAFTETGFIKNFSISRAAFNISASPNESQFRQVSDVNRHMTFDTTVHTEVALQKIRPVSDLGPHTKTQTRIEKIIFNGICAVHTKNRH